MSVRSRQREAATHTVQHHHTSVHNTQQSSAVDGHPVKTMTLKSEGAVSAHLFSLVKTKSWVPRAPEGRNRSRGPMWGKGVSRREIIFI